MTRLNWRTGLAALLLMAGSVAWAETYQFTNASGDRRWSNPANWDPAGVPGAQDQAEIDGHDVVMNNSVAVRDLILWSGSLQGATGTGDLFITLDGTFIVYGGQLIGGTFDGTNFHGSLSLNGGGALGWMGGTLYHRFYLNPDFRMSIDGATTKRLQDADLDNSSPDLLILADFEVENSRLFNRQGGQIEFLNASGTALSVHNRNATVPAGGTGFITNHGSVGFAGDWNLQGLQIRQAAGQIDLDSGKLDLGVGDLLLDAGALFDNFGSTLVCRELVNGGLISSSPGPLTVQAQLVRSIGGLSGASIDLQAGAIFNLGEVSVSTLNLGRDLASVVTNSLGGSVDGGFSVLVRGRLENYGQISASQSFEVAGRTTNGPEGRITVESGGDLQTLALENQGRVEVAGTLRTTEAARAEVAQRRGGCSPETEGSLVTSAGGNLVGLSGSSIIANGGNNIVALGGGNIIANGGANVIANGGANIIANGGGNVIANGGANIIANGGGNIIANGGGNRGGTSTITVQAGATLSGNRLCGYSGSTMQFAPGASLSFNLFELFGGLWRWLTGGRGSDPVQLTGALHNFGGRLLIEDGVRIQLEGDFVQEPAGLLEFGACAGKLQVSGAATLDGTLRLSGVSGQLDVLAFASSSGDFVIDGLAQSGGSCLEPRYGSSGLVLDPIDCVAAVTTRIEGIALLEGQADASGIEVSWTRTQVVGLPSQFLLLVALGLGSWLLGRRGRGNRFRASWVALVLLGFSIPVAAGDPQTTTTLSNGRFRFEQSGGFDFGVYLLTIRKPGFESRQVSVRIGAAAGSSVAAASVELRRNGVR